MQLHDIRQSTANGIIVYECLRKLRLSSHNDINGRFLYSVRNCGTLPIDCCHCVFIALDIQASTPQGSQGFRTLQIFDNNDMQGSINALDPCNNCYIIRRERRTIFVKSIFCVIACRRIGL